MNQRAAAGILNSYRRLFVKKQVAILAAVVLSILTTLVVQFVACPGGGISERIYALVMCFLVPDGSRV